MAIHFTCPTCKTTYTVNDRDAGKKSDCKKCGQRLQVPNPPRLKTVLGEEIVAPPEPSPAPEPIPPAAESPPAPPPSPGWYTPPPPRRPRRLRLPAIKLLMLIATGLWLLGMPTLGCLTYVGSMSGGTHVGGGYVLDGGELRSSEAQHSRAVSSAVTGALCCPTIPYVIVMVALGVAYFATKPDPPANAA